LVDVVEMDFERRLHIVHLLRKWHGGAANGPPRHVVTGP
jgi:hypothetical protein